MFFPFENSFFYLLFTPRSIKYSFELLLLSSRSILLSNSFLNVALALFLHQRDADRRTKRCNTLAAGWRWEDEVWIRTQRTRRTSVSRVNSWTFQSHKTFRLDFEEPMIKYLNIVLCIRQHERRKDSVTLFKLFTLIIIAYEKIVQRYSEAFSWICFATKVFENSPIDGKCKVLLWRQNSIIEVIIQPCLSSCVIQ